MSTEDYLIYLKENSSNKVYDNFGNSYSFDKSTGKIILTYPDYGYDEPEIDTLIESEFKELNPKYLEII